MYNSIIVGDCRDIMASMINKGLKINICVTSPPYFNLRDYATGTWVGGDPLCVHSCGGQVADNKAPGAITTGIRPGCDASKCKKCGASREDKQLGLERTPNDYVANLVSVFNQVRELLTDDGTLWLNLGDSFAAQRGASPMPAETFSGGIGGKGDMKAHRGHGSTHAHRNASAIGLKHKDLIGIPWRVAFALQEAGWYLRQDIIWEKPNNKPEAVKDRPSTAHEHVFLLSKSEKYYYDYEAVKEDTKDGRGKKNRRSVWSINTKPFKGSHFATMPIELINPCILAGSKVGGVVFDPFQGSGAVAEAAIRLGRKYAGCELNPEYKDLQDTRIQNALDSLGA